MHLSNRPTTGNYVVFVGDATEGTHYVETIVAANLEDAMRRAIAKYANPDVHNELQQGKENKYGATVWLPPSKSGGLSPLIIDVYPMGLCPRNFRSKEELDALKRRKTDWRKA